MKTNSPFYHRVIIVTMLSCILSVIAVFQPGGLRAQSTVTFNYTGTMQSFTVPSGITSLRIEARGAQGGFNTSSSIPSGLGAIMIGTFTVTPGQQLKILVGEQPSAGSGNGGGGGTFVTDQDDNPLIIAGGGGGSAGSTDSPSKHGQVSTAGGVGAAGGGTGGIDGNGGSVGLSGFQSGAGGGLLTNGANGWTTSTGGLAFINGGMGGTANANARGGFGGGGSGSSYVVGGGGGGYSGGGSGGNSSGGVGGGGGSFNGGTDQVNTGGANSGHGQVIIESISAIPPDPTSILVSENPVCSGSEIQLTAEGASGTVYWYTESCGGTEIATGNPVNVIPVTSTTYYARNYNGGQYSNGCASISVTTLSDYHISGYAKYYNNPKTPLDGLKITLKKSGVQQGTPVTTGANGWFDFGGLTNGTYDIEISSAHSSGLWQTWNGVNNTDYLLVSRHATGVAPLAMEPPVVRVAGDVIAPHPAINTLDANAVRNAARYGWLNPATVQPWFDIPKWVFSGTSSGAPLVAFELSCNNVTRNIYGLCAGDVNGSYIPPSGIKHAEASVDLIVKGSLPVSNEMIFPVRAERDMEIGAITLMLNFDAQNMEITAVEMPGFTGEQPWFQVNGNQLHIGWMSLDPARVTEGQTLLLIHSRLTAPASSLRFLLDPNPISELADGEGNVLYGAKLSVADAGDSKLIAENATFNVYPNPAKDFLFIEGQFTSAGPLSVELTDLNGRRILVSSFTSDHKGFSKTELDISGIAVGAYLLKVSSDHQCVVKKVMIRR